MRGNRMTGLAALMLSIVGLNGVLLWRLVRLKRALTSAGEQIGRDAYDLSMTIGAELANHEADQRYQARVLKGVALHRELTECPFHAKARSN